MLNRREALRSLGMGAAFGAVTAAGVNVAYAASSDLLGLIEAHQAAQNADAAARAAFDEAELAFEKEYEANPIRLRGHLAGCIDPAHDTREAVIRHHNRERITFTGERVQHLYPEAHKLIAERIRQMEADDIALWERAQEMLTQRRAAAGLDALEERQEEAEQAESAAYGAFAAYEPQSMADVAAKASYALQLVVEGGDARLHLDDLVASLSSRRAA